MTGGRRKSISLGDRRKLEAGIMVTYLRVLSHETRSTLARKRVNGRTLKR